MPRTLYSKLAMVLLGLFLVVGITFLIITLYTADMYYQEVRQQLNRDVARHIAAGKTFFNNDNTVNQLAIKGLFHTLMDINPDIEVYLLDPEGRILAFSAEPGKVKRKTIDPEPIQDWLEGSVTIPYLGEDPRGTDKSKVFSAARIPSSGKLQGYLYAIIGGEHYDTVVGKIQNSYILKLSFWMIAAGLLFTLGAGLLLFAKLTGRLEKLSVRMDSFRRSDLADPDVTALEEKAAYGDEIDRLTEIFSQMVERIETQVEEISRSEIMRRELVASVSHDIRAPLTTLHGYIETLLMKDGELTEEVRRNYLNIAIRHCKRLNRLIADLFELSRLDHPEVQVKPEPFSLTELLQDVIQKFQLAAKEKNVSLLTNFRPGLPSVNADIGLIERVLENLIENGLRHTPEGGTIGFEMTPVKNFMVIQIRDSGSGIPIDDLPQIFERFYQSGGGGYERFGYSGLGLAITKRILELHGCSIEVSSEVDSGTCFSFQLPLSTNTGI